MLIRDMEPSALFLDLERPADLAKLQDPESLLAANAHRLVCLDEIQRVPDLFPVLRYLIDQDRRAGRFLVLGSASRELIRQSSETLAGRVRYLELSPFQLSEPHGVDAHELWLRGGFPESALAENREHSFEWRLDFIRDFLERDVPALMPRVSVPNVRRIWQMLAHVHGQLLNMASLGNALDVSTHTIRHHIELLEGAFMLRRLPPFSSNQGKRLVKTPKVYLRDTGILHSLLGIREWEELQGHPQVGASWEGFAIENILSRCKREVQACFYRTARGAEIDLILERGQERIAVELKASSAPRPRQGFWSAAEDLGIERQWIVAPVEEGFPLRSARVASPSEFLAHPDNQDFLIAD
jgi:predicted AAA+ superfamily ATPase